MLTLHEAFLRDKDLDIEGRERSDDEARELIHEEFGLPRDSIGRERGGPRPGRSASTGWSRSWTRRSWSWPPIPTAANMRPRTPRKPRRRSSNLHLPEERLRIGDLLERLPAAARDQGAEAARRLGHAVAAEPEREDRRSSPPTSARWT